MTTELNLPKKKTYLLNVSLPRRVLAFLIDLIILDFFVMSVYSLSVERMLPKVGFSELMTYLQATPVVLSKAILLLTLLGLTIFAYFTYSQYKFSQTIGMHAFKLQIVSSEKKKKEVTLSQFLIRNLHVLPFFPFIFLWIIEPIYLAIYNERLLEKWSKTKLVEEHAL